MSSLPHTLFCTSRLKQFAFGRLSSWILAALFLVWSLAGFVGLRNGLMITFILLGLGSIITTGKILPRISCWIKILLLVFFLHTTASLFLSIDFPYSKQRWWADYAAPLLLAVSAVQFARDLNYKLLFAAIFGGLLLNGIVDIWQVFSWTDPTQWRGLFSDYGWENGYLLLTLPLILSVFIPDSKLSSRGWFFSLAIFSFFLAFLSSLSAWARANQLCFLAAMILPLSILICQRAGNSLWTRRVLIFYGALICGALIFRFLPSCYLLGPITSYEFVLLGLMLPLAFFAIPAPLAKKLVPSVIVIVVMVCFFGLIALYQMGGLKKTHSELVRKFSYHEVSENTRVVPIFGFGPGRDIVFMGIPDWFSRMNQSIYPAMGEAVPPETTTDQGSIRGHSHIQWINWRYELGYPGLVMICVLVGYALFLFLKLLLSGTYRGVNLALGACLLAFFLNIFMGQLFTAGFTQQFWVMWALFVANCVENFDDALRT